MKIIYLTLFLFIFILESCSPIYTIKNYSSRVDFYYDFNKSTANKKIKITLKNDSSFTAVKTGGISNDSLFFTLNILKEEEIKSDEIKDIQYFDTATSNIAARIVLNDGKVLQAKKAGMLTGSYIKTLIYANKVESLPIGKIKSVSYNKHWLGTPFGLITGTVIGFLELGYINGSSTHGGTNESSIAYPILTILTGGAIGWLVGYNYTYQFNP